MRESASGDPWRRPAGALTTLLLGVGVITVPVAASATTCDETTELMAKSCARTTEQDQFQALAVCANIGDPGKQAACIAHAGRDLQSAQGECRAQQLARANICGALGQAPYDPLIRPADFVNPITKPNPYFPLKPGTVSTFKSPESMTKVTVTANTRKILGVDCIVVRDTVYVDNQVEEDTFDYFAQDRQGNVWYFGEDTAEYVNGHVASIDGSFIAGRAGAKPGIIMAAVPAPGVTLRQEFDLGNAEDVAKYLSKGGTLTGPLGTFSKVLKTFETTPLEPDARENKYYAPGVGVVRTVDLETNEVEDLVDRR